ncbi:MAG: hypothetical protein A3J55_01735 [Candidatus Ryanbacteria bacterium RIFCSPHIGHO2_02_FULL_45_17b]|uniref:Uncharacterized protein n=1 Tax=Candidatus Ryanbacteria bacterium RIFCSPHIGHO2_01_FULL_45_22 TaxID=1802114 RepID=A0A1G2G3U6_9BACT|nr:MAG: hypothetical protein A2719_04335 [Candidatus Ryanbacteria bacterium RIFCSPHIGHO2_01_FULL_45_22]OGZ47626.1 MAG: hypothetical protein A3J55_01735 [Candidatus Ryanbacteria bacterium RIFCSPHIGHO2_02_FULL_45_17b]
MKGLFVVIALFLVFGALIFGIKGCPGRLTTEQIVQRRIADVSTKPYVGRGRPSEQENAKVLAIFEDIPNSQLVRVVVERVDDGMILSVLSTKHTAIVPGQRVQLVHVQYRETEFYLTSVFYIKE